MKTTPDYEQEYKEIGAVRFYNENGKWRYIHAGSLEAAKAEVEQFLVAKSNN